MMSFILTFVLFHIMYCPYSLLFLSHSTPDRLPFLVTVSLLGFLSYCALIIKEALSKHDQG